MLAGQLDEAILYLRRGIDLSPLDSRLSIWGAILALALMHAKDLDAALHQCVLACQRDHRSYLPRVVVAGIHLLRNDPALARMALGEAYRVMP
jgi:Flp pilus assembly protein TadD